MQDQLEKIALMHVSKKYGRKSAIASLSLTFKKGEHVALIGPSGAGKTTLLNLLAGTLSADEGQVFVDGESLQEFSNHKRKAKKIGMIRQQFDLVDQLPVIHNVLAGRLAEWGLLKSLLSLIIPQDKWIAVSALERVGLPDKIYEATSGLSGGEQQRVAIARLLVQNPEIILADEPVASLDPARAEDILRLLKEIAFEGDRTLIASLHSVDYARKYFDRLIALQDGKVFFDLPSDDVSDLHISSLYQLKEHH